MAVLMDKAEIFEINVNDEIEVRLTREGLRIYRLYWKKYNLRPRLLKKNHDGWVSFQLWDFMHIFGNFMYMGGPNVMIGNTVRIAKS